MTPPRTPILFRLSAESLEELLSKGPHPDLPPEVRVALRIVNREMLHRIPIDAPPGVAVLSAEDAAFVAAAAILWRYIRELTRRVVYADRLLSEHYQTEHPERAPPPSQMGPERGPPDGSPR